MLFLAHYRVAADGLELAMAKRLEGETAQPDGFRLVCEYAIHGQPPPFGGFMVFETAQAEDLNFLTMFFAPSVTFDIRPCSDVLEAVRMTQRLLGHDAALD
jgi:hypothetical protein